MDVAAVGLPRFFPGKRRTIHRRSGQTGRGLSTIPGVPLEAEKEAETMALAVPVDDHRPIPYQPLTRPRVRAAAMTVYVAALAAWLLIVGPPTGPGLPVLIFAVVWLLTIVWNIESEPGYHLSFIKDWWPALIWLLLYFNSYWLTRHVGLPVHIDPPIRFDEWLGAGHTPSQRLQDAWCGQPCRVDGPARWYDVALVVVYVSYFLTSAGLALVLWFKSRAEWARWLRLFVVLHISAVVIYVCYPMVPPWMASADGYLAGDVVRITGRGLSVIGVDGANGFFESAGNPIAAMPSVHAAATLLVACFGIWRLRSWWRWLLLVYPALMVIALVYFGEHYVFDIVFGYLLAAVVFASCWRWERWRESSAPAPEGNRDP
jgi:membrane-associated phospholipid phosphatase